MGWKLFKSKTLKCTSIRCTMCLGICVMVLLHIGLYSFGGLFLLDKYRSDEIIKDRLDLQTFVNHTARKELALNGSLYDYLDQRNPCWVEKTSRLSYRGNAIGKILYKYDRNHQYKAISKAFRHLEFILKKRAGNSSSTWKYRCLPSFYLAGVYKAGTTDLYAAMCTHPDVVCPVVKESGFWTRHQLYNVTFEDYLQFYDPVAEILRTKRNGITLDASPENFFMWNWTAAKSETPQFISKYIRALTPEAKIIIMLRNPTTWLFSLYRHITRESASIQDFNRCINNRIIKFNTCLKNKTLDDCVMASFVRRDPCAIYKAIYSVFIQQWFRVFRKDQILILRSEDYYGNRTQVMTEIFRFLGISHQELTPFRVRNKGRFLPGRQPSRTFDTIRQFMEPYNRRLADLLHNNGFLWH